MSVSWQPRRVSARTSSRALTGTDVDQAAPPACGGVTSATYPSPFLLIMMAISRSPLLGRGHARSPGSRPFPACPAQPLGRRSCAGLGRLADGPNPLHEAGHCGAGVRLAELLVEATRST